MGIAVILYVLMCWSYKYVEDENVLDEIEKERLSTSSSSSYSSDDHESSEDKEEKGEENNGFSE